MAEAPRERVPWVRLAVLGTLGTSVFAVGLAWFGRTGPVLPPSETVVLVVVDDFRPDHLAPYGYPFDPTPNLTELARDGFVLEGITGDVATNPSLATLLTGVPVAWHRLSSLHHVGSHRLDGLRETLAERLRGAGYRTRGAVSIRQLEARLSGLDRGFEAWADEGLPRSGEPRPGAETVEALLAVLGAEDPGPLLAFLHLGDLRDDALPPTAELAPWLARHAGALEEAEPELAALAREDAGTFAERVARRRGSPEWSCLRRAAYDARLARVDLALGLLLEHLRTAGRLEEAWICVVGSRGKRLTEADPGGPEGALAEEIVRVPLIVRLPRTGRPGELAALTGPVSTSRVAQTIRAAGEEFDRDLTLFPGAGLGGGWSGTPLGRALGASRSTEAYWQAYVTSDATSSAAFLDAAHRWRLTVGEASPVGERRDGGGAAPPPPFLVFSNLRSMRRDEGVRYDFEVATAEEITLTVRVSHPTDDRALLGKGNAFQASREEPVRLRRHGAEEWDFRRPYQPHLLEVSRDGVPWPDEGLVVVGLEGPLQPVPFLPAARGEPWPEEGEPDEHAEPPPGSEVDVVRVPGGVEVRLAPSPERTLVFAHRYPFSDPPEPLPVREDPGVERLTPEALPDGACVEVAEGTQPRFELRAGERLALLVRRGDGVVPLSRVRYLGRRFVGERLALVVPSWIPGRPDWFSPELARLPAPSGVRSRTIRIQRDSVSRRGRGPGEPPPLGLTPDDLAFLNRLGKNE